MKIKVNWEMVSNLINKLKEDLINENKSSDNISVFVFPQVWESTALGYDEVGADALVKADTLVLYEEKEKIARVYFGKEKLAYELINPNSKFFEDIKNRTMLDCKEYEKYLM